MSKFIIGDLIKEAAEAYEAGNYLKSKLNLKMMLLLLLKI